MFVNFDSQIKSHREVVRSLDLRVRHSVISDDEMKVRNEYSLDLSSLLQTKDS